MLKYYLIMKQDRVTVVEKVSRSLRAWYRCWRSTPSHTRISALHGVETRGCGLTPAGTGALHS